MYSSNYIICVSLVLMLSLQSSLGKNVPDGLVVFKIPKIDEATRDVLLETANTVQNCYRAKHGASPLTLDPSISQVSQSWADHLVSVGDLQHSQGPYGENLFASGGDLSSGALPIYYWYKEYLDCNYFGSRNATKQGCVTGHFTQVVWKGSQRVGYGVATGSSWTYFVANYDPPGNYLSDAAANVGPPSDNNIDSCLPPGVQTLDDENIQIL